MKKLLMVVLSLGILTSCATQKDYIIITDNYEIPSVHEHIEIDGEDVCFYFEAYCEERTDTLYFE